TPDRLVVAAVDLAVGERLERHAAEPDPELGGDLGGQIRVRPTREEHQPLAGLDLELTRGGAGGLEQAHRAFECRTGWGRMRGCWLLGRGRIARTDVYPSGGHIVTAVRALRRDSYRRPGPSVKANSAGCDVRDIPPGSAGARERFPGRRPGRRR